MFLAVIGIAVTSLINYLISYFKLPIIVQVWQYFSVTFAKHHSLEDVSLFTLGEYCPKGTS